MSLEAKIPAGPLPEKWERRRAELRRVDADARGEYRVIIVGTGLAGASAAATLAEQGFQVEAFCFQDSARRAHSISAQGGITGVALVEGVLRGRHGRIRV